MGVFDWFRHRTTHDSAGSVSLGGATAGADETASTNKSSTVTAASGIETEATEPATPVESQGVPGALAEDGSVDAPQAADTDGGLSGETRTASVASDPSPAEADADQPSDAPHTANRVQAGRQ
jgi:hypothetical protein